MRFPLPHAGILCVTDPRGEVRVDALSSPQAPVRVHGLGVASCCLAVLVLGGHPALLFSSGTQAGALEGQIPRQKSRRRTDCCMERVGSCVQTDGPMPAWGGEGASCPSCRRQCPSRGPMAAPYAAQQHTRCLTHSDTQHRSLSPREAVISSFSEAWAFVRPGPGAETAKCRL